MTGRSIHISILMTVLLSFSAGAQSLTVQVDGLKNMKGQLLVAVYDSSVSFPKEGEELLGEVVSLASAEPFAIFKDLEPGKYAVAVFHDADADNELSTNAIGYPLESYGFSRNAFGPFGAPPKFSKAAVEVKEDEVIRIRLR